MPDLRQALKDFVATSNSGKYSDEKTLLSKFPELQGYDINVLRDFVATSNSGKYANEDEVFSKFPEFGFSQEVKKKSEGNVPSSTASQLASGQSVSPKPTETLAVGPMGITGLQRTAKQKPAEVYNNPEFLNPLISTITPDLMSSSEESLVPKMNYQYGPLGFKFEESGYTGNYMKAKAPNGKEQEFSLGWFSMDKKGESEKLKKFIAENSAAIPADTLSKAEQEYQGFNKKFTSQKEVDESIKTISNEAENFNKQKIDYFKEKSLIDTEKKNLSNVPSSERTTAEYIAKLNALRERENQLGAKQQALINDGSRIKNNSALLERSIGKYVDMQSQQGTWYGTAFNSLLSGIGSFSSAAQGLVTDIGAAITPDVMVMPEFEWKQKYIETAAKKGIAGPKKDNLGKVSNEEYNKWFSSLGDVKEELHDEIIDKAKKQQKYSKLDNGKTIQDTIREGLVDLAGDDETTKQYIEKKKENFVAGAVIGAIESIPAFVGGGRGYAGAASRLVRLFAQSEDATMNEMSKNPEFENISENEKRLVSVPISITTAVLEEMGFRNILSNSGLVNRITMRVIGKAGATTTAKTFGELVRNEVDGMLAKGALTLVGGALAEAETGATQEVANITVKEIYNEVKGKDMFKVPKTVGEFATQVVKAGGQEAIGGLVLGMPTAISAAVSKKGFLNISDEQFEIFENTVNNEKLQSAFITNLKNKINAGTLTTSEAKEELNNYRKSVSLYRAIPEGLSTQQKKEAMNLLSEKQGLEQQIENKDPALVKPQQERINAINESLNKISQNAVQEQSTDESVLRTEQQQGVGIPQVELQQVGEGNVQPETVAEGTQEVPVPAVNEEEVTPQEAQRAQSNVEALIESENNAAQQEGYKYKDLHEQDPKLAALQYAKDNVEFLESGDFERNLIAEGETPERAKERSENALKTIKQDIADLEVSLNANQVVSSKTLETAPVVEEVAPVEEAAPVVEAEPVEEVEQYVPITEDSVSHDNFTKDNAVEYETDFRTDDNGREREYISRISVSLNDEDGNTIGNLVKIIDEDKNVSWNAEDEDGNTVGKQDFDSKAEAQKALVDKANKLKKKEFDREAKILAKAKEKEAIKKAKAVEKEAAKKAKAEEKAAAKQARTNQPQQITTQTQQNEQQPTGPIAGNRLFNKPLKRVAEIADRYYQRIFGAERPKYYGSRGLDEARAKRIADAFTAMQHNPNDPEVKAAYEAMAKETLEQYKDFLNAGFVVEINNEEPYANSQEMIEDLRNNNRIKIFSTESGFGDNKITAQQRAENPLLKKTKYKDVNGKPLLVNDVFRAIHDFFGHAELGNSFGPKGEENAWNVHARMYSPLARRAMTTETRGQNSFVNFSGVNEKIDKVREEARKLRDEGKVEEAKQLVDKIYEEGSFADQKVGLLPEEFSQFEEGNIGDVSMQPQGLQASEPVTEEGPTAEDLASIDAMLDLDMEDEDNMLMVLNALDRADKALDKRLFGQANNFLLGFPLGTASLVVKSIKLLVKGGMMLRDAIRKVAADNNISQDSVKDILNIAPIQDGFNALMDKVNAMVQRQTARGTEQKRMVSNVDTLVRNSEVYQNATDAQKKILEREARTQAGARERRAPSIGRILGALKDIKNVSREDKLKIINQIRVLAKDAAKDLANEIKSLSDTGRITLKQAANIVSRFGKVNMLNEVSISKFVDYMTKVFADSEYDNKINLAKSKLKAAKKNIATKIGIADGLILPLQRLFSVNPTLVPTEYLDRYLELVNMFGERQAVLSLEEKSKVTKDVEAILSKINEEQSLLDELSDRFNSFENKVMDKDGELDYDATIEAMLKEGIIDAKEATMMKENKSRMVPREGKEKKSEEEISKEKEELINALRDLKVLTEGLSTQDEKDLAERLIKLISSDAVNKLSNNDLKNLLKVLDNINNNYLPHYAQLMVEKLTAVNNAKTLTSSIKNAVVAPLSGLYSRVKSLLTKRGAISEMIRRNPLFNIDQLFGNYKTKDIFNAILNKAAEGESKFVKQLKTIQNILEKAEEKVAKSFKLDPNKTLMSKFKMMTYLVQLEYESNEGNKQVNPANEYLKATIKHIDEGKSQFGERDANMLQEILDKYKKEDGSIDNEKLYNSFNQAEKNAIKDIRGINESLKEKAEYTAAIIRGDRINPLTNYVHLNVLHEHQPNDIVSGVAFVSDYNNSMRPSTKAKSLIERTGKVSPLNFDVFASAQRGAKFVLMDYNLTEPIRTARMTINQTIKNFEEEGRIPKEKRAIINAINDAFEEVVENVLTNSFVSTSIADDVVDYINKQGYRAVLAGTGRFVSELMSNIGFAVIADPNAFATGIANKGVIMSSDAPMIMENVGSKQVNRIFPTDTLSGKLVDTSILQQASGIKGAKSKNSVANKIQQIWNRSGKKYTNSVELTADALISTPDKLIMRPMWFGSFANTFETITGQKINFEKIASKDEAYMKEHKDAIEKAKTVADEFSVMTGSTENPFMGILKGTVKPNQSVALRAFNNFNNFMTKFLIFEYVTARTAINAAMGNGSLNKRQGVALLGAVTTRMVVYTLLTQMLGAGLIGLFFDDDEEEDDKSFMQKLGQAFTSAFTSMIFGRDFGNVTKSIVNYGLERVNENYLDFLREGEYDPYKDAIQYSIVPPEKKGKQRDLADFLFNMGGAFGPALKTADFITRKALEPDKKKQDAIERQQNEINVRIPLEVLGNAGFIPLYKDVRKAVLKDMYKDLANAESNAEDKKKAELQKLHGFKNQTEMKRYKPELWEETFGPKAPDYNAKQAKKALKKAKDSVERAMKDDLYDYVPKKKKGGFGSFEFGSANKTKKGGGFGSIKFGK